MLPTRDRGRFCKDKALTLTMNSSVRSDNLTIIFPIPSVKDWNKSFPSLYPPLRYVYIEEKL